MLKNKEIEISKINEALGVLLYGPYSCMATRIPGAFSIFGGMPICQ